MGESRNGGSDEGREGSRSRDGTSPLEWVVAGLSALLVLGTIAFLLHDALAAPSSPPRVTVEADSIHRAGPGWLVEFRATNDGQTTAGGLTVEGTLEADTGTVERSQATIDYVPAGGTRKGGLYFTKDPARHRLKLRPTGYDRP